MKNQRYLFVLLLLAFAGFMKPQTAKASHAAGGEIVFEHIADSTYFFIIKFYRACSGAGEPATMPLCMTDSCNSFQQTVTFDKWQGSLPNGLPNGSPVSAGCSQYGTTCTDPTSAIPGYREWWYTGTVELPTRCTKWRFSTIVVVRNGSQNIPGVNFYIESTFNNQYGNSAFRENSSPFFSVKPIPYACLNQPNSYNNGAVDANGDSLATEVIQPLTAGTACGPGTNIPFNAPGPGGTAYAIPLNPFQTNNSFIISSSTGQMTFTPTQQGAHTIVTKVSQYRNGVLIGYVMRDIQLQVLPNCSTVRPTLTVNATNTGPGGRVEACVNQNLSFTYNIVSTDTDAVLIAEDNRQSVIPAATTTYTGQKTESITGTFSWTPTLADVGSKILVVTAKDSTCKPPGIMLFSTYTIEVYVWEPTRSVPDTSVCPNETAYLTVKGGANFVWSVLPGGSPITSLTCTSCTSPVATPGVVTRYVVTSTVNPFCNNNKDTVQVSVLPGLNFTPMTDIITCPGNGVQLNAQLSPPPGVRYSTKWTPATFLNNDTLNVPTSTPNVTTTYSVVISSSDNQCKAYDTVLVDVLTGFSLATVDTAVCDGISFTPSITGDSRYTYEWTASNGTGQFSNPNVMDPVITPSPLGKTTYIVRAKYVNCPKDSVAEFDIDVEPNPTVVLGDDASLCENDTMKLWSLVQPTNFKYDLNWTPGASLNNTTVANPIFKAQQTTSLRLTATSPLAKCTAFDTMKITVFPGSFITLEGDTSICPGTTTQLRLKGNGMKSFSWYPNNRISDANSTTPIVNPLSTQTYTVYAVDTNACFDTATAKVIVHPGARLFLPETVTIYPGESYQMQPGGNCSYFTWFPSLGLSKSDASNPMVKPEVNTKYIVTGTTESGCSTTDSITILVAPESILDVPNAFSPGTNNGTFKVLRRGDATLKSFTIFNRWGQKVFETNDINKGWDGTMNGEAQPLGVYIYTVDAITPTGRRFTKQGNVTLVR